MVLEPRVLGWVADSEAHPPTLHQQDIWGKRKDELFTSEGWRSLQDLGISEGIVAIVYENIHLEFSRVYQFLKYHLWTGSCAYVTCPSAMSDGAAKLLSQHFEKSEEFSTTDRAAFSKAYAHLVSRNTSVAWTSGQWMTERVGGSDIRNTETRATYSPESHNTVTGPRFTDTDGDVLGPWLINGFKWFSSATDANMTILLARTPEGGISAFYAPMRKVEMPQKGGPSTEMQRSVPNGITIERLKSKMGTRALPTAEVSLHDTRAYLLGQPGQGIKEISAVLNITRVHNAVTACGLWGRGLAISRAFARVRRVKGELLMDVPAHVRTMASMHVDYRAYMHLTFFVVALLGVSERPDQISMRSPTTTQVGFHCIVPSNGHEAELLLRILTPVTKALTAKAAISGLAECMESLGGVGYLDSSSPLDIEHNIARLYRDANVLSIWEGTTDVMAEDTIRVLKGKSGPEVVRVLGEWIKRVASEASVGGTLRYDSITETSVGGTLRYDSITETWNTLAAHLQDENAGYLTIHGREMMEVLAWIVCAVLLVSDAGKDGDENAALVAKRWIIKRHQSTRVFKVDTEQTVRENRDIVFKDSNNGASTLGAKL